MDRPWSDLYKLYEAMKVAQVPVSLETEVGAQGDALLSDAIEDKSSPSPIDEVISTNLREQTADLLRSLSPREELVLRMRFGVGDAPERTLEEVGRSFNVTRERIRQIQSKALRKLQRSYLAKELRSFLEDGRGERHRKQNKGSPAERPRRSCAGARAFSGFLFTDRASDASRIARPRRWGITGLGG